MLLNFDVFPVTFAFVKPKKSRPDAPNDKKWKVTFDTLLLEGVCVFFLVCKRCALSFNPSCLLFKLFNLKTFYQTYFCGRFEGSRGSLWRVLSFCLPFSLTMPGSDIEWCVVSVFFVCVYFRSRPCFLSFSICTFFVLFLLAFGLLYLCMYVCLLISGRSHFAIYLG